MSHVTCWYSVGCGVYVWWGGGLKRYPCASSLVGPSELFICMSAVWWVTLNEHNKGAHVLICVKRVGGRKSVHVCVRGKAFESRWQMHTENDHMWLSRTMFSFFKKWLHASDSSIHFIVMSFSAQREFLLWLVLYFWVSVSFGNTRQWFYFIRVARICLFLRVAKIIIKSYICHLSSKYKLSDASDIVWFVWL